MNFQGQLSYFQSFRFVEDQRQGLAMLEEKFNLLSTANSVVFPSPFNARPCHFSTRRTACGPFFVKSIIPCLISLSSVFPANFSLHSHHFPSFPSFGCHAESSSPSPRVDTWNTHIYLFFILLLTSFKLIYKQMNAFRAKRLTLT